MKGSGNTILVTGGGSGIGRALAQRLADAGNTLIVAGRRAGPLQGTIAGRPGMEAVTVDMTDAASIRDLAARVLASHSGLNALINNAGIMRHEDLAHPRDLADAVETVETNLLGPIRLIDALISHLSGQRGAAIVNVTSGLAFVPLVATPTYSATKAALHSYTQALRAQLAGKVEVIELAPPAVQTELTPGQSTREGYLPLEAFADEAFGLLTGHPTPPEVLVERVKVLRNAEAEGRFDKTFALLNGH
ncbi:MAG: SDR family oxidoreductase [Paracoccaceae bacterium]